MVGGGGDKKKNRTQGGVAEKHSRAKRLGEKVPPRVIFILAYSTIASVSPG